MASSLIYSDLNLMSVSQMLNTRVHNVTTIQRANIGATLGIGNNGFHVWDTDLNQNFYWNGSVWVNGTAPIIPPVWGNITGILSNQTDLQNALNLKYDVSNPAGYITLADIPDASSTTTGLLTSTDWNTFNNKASNTGVPDRIPFYNSSGNFITENTVQVGSVFGERVIYLYNAAGTTFTQLQGGFIAISNGVDTFSFGPSGVLLPSSNSFITVGHQIQTDSRVYIAGGSSTISPLTIEAGTLLTSTKAGVIENDGNHLYYTSVDAGVRYQLDQQGFGTTAGGELAGTYPNPTLLNSAVIGKALTGYISGAGTISATDSILSAIQKLNGNQAALVTGVSSVSNSDGTLTISPTTGAVIASLNLAHANTWTALQTFEKDGLGTTIGNAVSIINATAATSGNQQYSPSIFLGGQRWSGTASESAGVGLYVIPVQAGVPNLAYYDNVNGTITPRFYIGYSTSTAGIILNTALGTSYPFNIANGAGTHISCLTTNTTLLAQSVVNCSSPAAAFSVGSGTNAVINIGTITSVASAQLNMASTTRGFLPPRLTTTQKNAIASPATGLVLYDTTLNKLCVYTGAAWETVTST